MKGKILSITHRLFTAAAEKDMPAISLEDSIAQHIHLLITTVLGEKQRMMPNMAAEWWDSDFDIKASNNEVKEQIENAVKASITV